MFHSGALQSDLDDLAIFNNNGQCGDNFCFNGFDYLDPLNVAGPSQTYAGADVLGDFDSYPHFLTPFTAPISLNPAVNEPYPNQGYASQFYHPSPVPTLSHGSPSLSPEPYTVPVTPALLPYSQPQAIPNLDGLDLGFPAVAESLSLPTVHSTPEYHPTWEDLLSKFPPLDPFCLDLPADPVTGATSPETTAPVPTAPSSGSRRTRQQVRDTRRYNPLRAAKKKVDSDPDSQGWDQTLVRFRAHLDTLYNVHNGQPSGGLVPEKALARVSKFAKEDLKRSPLRNTKAGEGKRSRDVETYLEGLLQAIRQANPTPFPATGESDDRSRTVDAFSKLADELEVRLAVTNQHQALRQSTAVGKEMNYKQSQKQKKRSEMEKERRCNERYQVERISRLFRASGKSWSRKDVLGLAVLFLLYGPAAFPLGFIQVRHTVAGL